MTTITRHRGRTSLAISLVAALLLALPLHSVQADTNRNPNIVPITDTVAGFTYPDWSAKWWQYVFSVPANENPLLDPTGQYCGVRQPYLAQHVFFLVGSFAVYPNPPAGTVVRNCTVPTGTMLFFPVANDEEDNVNPGGTNFSHPIGYLTGAANALMSPSKVGTLSASIDGVPVQQVVSYRTLSPVFSYTLPDNNLYAAVTGQPVPAQTVNPAVGDGYYLMTTPLSAGTYKIEFAASGFGLDVTYNLMVQ